MLNALPVLVTVAGENSLLAKTFGVRSLDTTPFSLFGSLGSAHRGGDVFPLRCQMRKIVSDSGEIAIDRSSAATRCVSRWIFQRRG